MTKLDLVPKRSSVRKPPARKSTQVEAFLNDAFLSMMHLGSSKTLLCKQCRKKINLHKEDEDKFVECPHCSTTQLIIHARMTQQSPSHEEWVRCEGEGDQMEWARMLSAKEEEYLDSLFASFKSLDRDGLESKLDELNATTSSFSTDTQLLNQLVFTTAYTSKKISTFGFVRDRQSDILEWVPAHDIYINTLENLPGLKITPSEVVSVCAQDFDRRLEWFRTQVDRLVDQKGRMDKLTIKVRREHLLQDATNCINTLNDPTELWRNCSYEFSGEHAMDSGGVAREFFTLVGNMIFDSSFGLFEVVTSQDGNFSYRFNRNSNMLNPLDYQYYRFLGRLMAKALLDGYQVGGHFTRDIYKHLLSAPLTMNDLHVVDPMLAKNVESLQTYEGDIADMCLDFTTTTKVMDTMEVVELVEGGKDIDVTKDNLEEYTELLLRHITLDRHNLQLSCFLHGFDEVIPTSLLSVFDAPELELLLCGLPTIDLADWKKHTTYRGVYKKPGAGHKVIKWFWDILGELDQEQLGKFLQYITGSTRVPVQGFKALQGDDGANLIFSIQSTQLSTSVYPIAHTCFNRLELPLYRSKADMQAKVMEVLSMHLTGFNLE